MCLHCAQSSNGFNLICNMTTFRQKSFDLTTGVAGLCKDDYVLACCCIRDSI